MRRKGGKARRGGRRPPERRSPRSRPRKIARDRFGRFKSRKRGAKIKPPRKGLSARSRPEGLEAWIGKKVPKSMRKWVRAPSADGRTRGPLIVFAEIGGLQEAGYARDVMVLPLAFGYQSAQEIADLTIEDVQDRWSLGGMPGEVQRIVGIGESRAGYAPHRKRKGR